MHRIHRCLSALVATGGLFGLVTVQAAVPEGVLGEVQGIVLVRQGGETLHRSPLGHGLKPRGAGADLRVRER